MIKITSITHLNLDAYKQQEIKSDGSQDASKSQGFGRPLSNFIQRERLYEIYNEDGNLVACFPYSIDWLF